MPRAPTSLRQVSEGEVAHAVAAFMAGEPWRLPDAQWKAGGTTPVNLRQEGDLLVHRGVPIFDRRAAGRVLLRPAQRPEKVSYASICEAQAVCAVALRGDHLALYPN